jgi:hypothetical protein
MEHKPSPFSSLPPDFWLILKLTTLFQLIIQESTHPRCQRAITVSNMINKLVLFFFQVCLSKNSIITLKIINFTFRYYSLISE